MVEGATPPQTIDTGAYFLTLLPALAGAFFVAFGGAKWLSNEANKQILQKGGSIAAGKPGSSKASETIDSASKPIEVLNTAKEM